MPRIFVSRISSTEDLLRGANTMLKRVILLLVLAMLAASVCGCKTVQGIGEDIKNVGEAGEEAIP